MRGVLTESIKRMAFNYFAKDISEVELRLMAYIQFILMNEKVVDNNKVNMEELDIIEGWLSKGYLIKDEDSKLSCRVDFWDIMCRILYVSYVNFDGVKNE